jgi:hypothetical protein
MATFSKLKQKPVADIFSATGFYHNILLSAQEGLGTIHDFFVDPP